MDRVDAYTGLFALRESGEDVDRYIRLLSTTGGAIPDEVLRVLGEVPDGDGPDFDTDDFDADDFEDGDFDTGDFDTEDFEDGDFEDPDVDGTDFDAAYIGDPDGEAPEPEPEAPEAGLDAGDNAPDGGPDPESIVSEFIDNIRGKAVFREIRSDGSHHDLSVAVSSFCTHYLIELRTSPNGDSAVADAVAREIDVAGILRLLADYVETDDLNALAQAVVLVRNFLGSRDEPDVAGGGGSDDDSDPDGQSPAPAD